MAGQHDAPQPGVGLDVVAQPQAEVEAGALPRKPADGPTPDLLRGPLAARGCRQGDHGVGMNVVDVRERQIGVQRGVDGCGARV